LKIPSLKISQTGLIKYFSNTSWLFLERVLRMVSSLFIGVWMARYLGPTNFGLFSYVNAYVALFAVVANLGIDTIVVKRLVKADSNTGPLVGTSFFLKLGASMLMLIICGLTSFLVTDTSDASLLILIAATSMIFQSFSVIDLFFQSKVLSKFVVFSNLFSLFLSILVKVYLLTSGASLLLFVCVVVFESIVTAVSLLYFYVRHGSFISDWQFDLDIAKKLLVDGLPLILSGLVVAIYMKIDQIMIEQMLDITAVGEYAAAARLSEFWYFIPVIISSSLFPAIVNAKNISLDLYYKRLQALFNLLFWLSVIITITVASFSSIIIDFLFGSDYSGAKAILVIHVYSGIFAALGISSAKWFIQEELQNLLFYRALLGAILNVILNLILIKKFGGIGAAYATLAAQASSSYLFNIFNKRTHKLFMMQSAVIISPFLKVARR